MTDVHSSAEMPRELAPELWLPVAFAEPPAEGGPPDAASTMASEASALRAALRRRPAMTLDEATEIARDAVRTLDSLYGVLDAVRERLELHGQDPEPLRDLAQYVAASAYRQSAAIESVDRVVPEHACGIA
jgi:hypothetical protein